MKTKSIFPFRSCHLSSSCPIPFIERIPMKFIYFFSRTKGSNELNLFSSDHFFLQFFHSHQPAVADGQISLLKKAFFFVLRHWGKHRPYFISQTDITEGSPEWQIRWRKRRPLNLYNGFLVDRLICCRRNIDPCLVKVIFIFKWHNCEDNDAFLI